MMRCQLCDGPCEYTPREFGSALEPDVAGGWSCLDADCDGSWNPEVDFGCGPEPEPHDREWEVKR